MPYNHEPQLSNQNNACWYVLNFVGRSSKSCASKEVESFNARHSTSIQLFAPTYIMREERQGEIKIRTVNLTFHYVFVRGTIYEVKTLCSESNGFSFLINHSGNERYAVIDDTRMTQFMNIARAYKNCLPYFSIDEVDLEDGDLIEVVKGDFPGLVGTFMPKAKSKKGNVILTIFNNVGTVAFDVNVSDVRVLEFSKNATRANDQIDAFVPQLFQALRLFDKGETLSKSLAAKLSVFCGRMEVVKINNRKLNARLQMLLYAANHIIGNLSEAAKALNRYEDLKDSVTNEWSILAIALISSVITKNKKLFMSGYERVKHLEAKSKMQHSLLDEYEYYFTRKE